MPQEVREGSEGLVRWPCNGKLYNSKEALAALQGVREENGQAVGTDEEKSG